MSTNTLLDLVGRDLKDFRVVEMTEVYEVNEDGRKLASIGFFKDLNVATVFAESYVGRKTKPVFVLTDEVVGYALTEESLKVFDDQKEAFELRKKAIAKLTYTERKLFDF